MKVRAYANEEYITLENDHHCDDFNYCDEWTREIELSKGELDRVVSAMKEFDSVQELLRERWLK